MCIPDPSHRTKDDTDVTCALFAYCVVFSFLFFVCLQQLICDIFLALWHLGNGAIAPVPVLLPSLSEGTMANTCKWIQHEVSKNSNI